jgi:hypothetical protein
MAQRCDESAAVCRKMAHVNTRRGPLKDAATVVIDPTERVQDTRSSCLRRFELWHSGVRRRGGSKFVVGIKTMSVLQAG